jgi:hypothetical protein
VAAVAPAAAAEPVAAAPRSGTAPVAEAVEEAAQVAPEDAP